MRVQEGHLFDLLFKQLEQAISLVFGGCDRWFHIQGDAQASEVDEVPLLAFVEVFLNLEYISKLEVLELFFLLQGCVLVGRQDKSL